MVSKNNIKNKMEQAANRTPHYAIRKVGVGVASVLISTTLYMGANTAKADSLPNTATDVTTTKPTTVSSASSVQENTTANQTAESTTSTVNNSVDSNVGIQTNSVTSTTATTTSSADSNKATVNTTDQTQSATTAEDKSNVANKAESQTSTANTTTPTRVERSLAAAPTTNSKELVENQDYTVSNVSLEDHKKQDNFDEDATFLHADIKAKDGDVIANKEITVTFNEKEFNRFWSFKNQDITYNNQVIGSIVKTQDRAFKIAFNNNTKGLKNIDLSLKIYLVDYPYALRELYTNNKAKNNEKYMVRHNYQIGSTNYYVDREATIHYWGESEPTTQSTYQFDKSIAYWYGPQEWYPLSVVYYTTRDGKTYAQIGSMPRREESYDLGLGKGFITPDTKSVTISFEPSSKYYSEDANKLKVSDTATFDEKTVTHRTQYDQNDLVVGTTDVYTSGPKGIDEVSDKHTYYVKDLIKLDGNTLIATDATTSTGLNNLSARSGAGTNGYVGVNDATYTVVSSDDLRKFVIDNTAKIIETRGKFLTSNSDYSNPGRIVAHNNTTGQDVYFELHNKVSVYDKDVTTPPDGAILVSAGKDVPTKVYDYTSTDIPSNVDKSKLTKEVTRTINVHNPNGTVDTTVQTVTFHQTVTVAGDEVVYNNDWNTPYNYWDTFNVPQIENYKASRDTVGSVWIGGVNKQNETVDITYTMTRQVVNGSWTFKYTDKMTGEEIMPATTIHAQFVRDIDSAAHKYGDWTYVPNSFSQTGTHVNFTGDPQKLDNFDNGNFDNFTFNVGLPAAPNSNYNQAYGNFAITFQLRNNSDQPDVMEKTSSVPYDKVSVKQESQTRTLTEHYVYADGDKKGQKIADDAVVEIFYSREVKSINDQVVSTSEWKLDTTKGDKATPGYHVVSGTWTNLPTTWSVVSVSAPTIQGYTTDTNETENNPGHVSSLRWVFPTQSGVLNDTFMPGNKHTYEYQPEHTTYYHANDQSIKVTYIDDDKGGASVKSDTLSGKTDQTVKTGITIPENYSVVGTTPSEYTFKASGNADIIVHLKHVIDTTFEEKTITRTIKVTDPTGKVTTIPQTAKVTRTVGTDKVTNQKTYGDWTTSSFDGYDVPTIEGYTASQSKVDKATVDGNTKDSEVNINYTANDQAIKINYIDSDNNDSVVKSDTLSGKTDQTVKTDITIPDGYILEGNVPSDYTFKASGNTDITVELKHGTTTVTPDKPKTTGDKLPDNPSKNYPSGVAKNDLNRTITRTIKITDPKGKVTTETQTVHLTRSATVDEVTGKVSYSNWTTGSFDSYDVPEVKGYTATQSKVNTATVTSDTQDSEVNISYTANDQTIKINYVDSDNNDSVIKSDTLTGKTDQTVKTGVKIPDGYVVSGNVPTDYTFKAKDNADITVKLKHGTITVTPDKPKTTGDKLPDNPSKNYPSGVAENDLNKAATRTIKVTDPTGKVTTEIQMVHLTRTAIVDEVTGKVTYSDWTTGKWNSYSVPEVSGYTATTKTISENSVDINTKDQTIEVAYIANSQSIKINYVDDDKGGATVKSSTLNGKTDETVKTGITIPENYTVVGTTPSEYTFKAEGNADITVHLKHVISITSEEKTITRTIKVTNPNGGVMTIPQSAKSTRTVSTDKVTGKVTYGDWSKADLDDYDVPLIEGYTASQPSVSKTIVDGNSKNSVVEINYTPNKQVISIDYVDNGKVISTQVLTGKTDETVKTNIQSPDKDKYVVVGDTPDTYTFKAKGNEDIRVEVKHVINDSIESKDVTRTIVVTSPDGKKTTQVQKANVSRTVHTDAVAGAKTYDEWSKATLDKYDVPTVDGYTPSLNVVEGLEVDGNSKDSVVKVTYTANSQSIKINYVDDDNGGATVKSDTLNGKTNQTVKTGITIPDGYVIDGNVPDSYTFKAKDNADITVKLKHGTTTVTADNPKTTNDKLPDNPSKNYPSGVAENDLNKTVIRTINVTTPDGKISTITQTVHLTRNAIVDEVTGRVTYSDWSTGKWDNYEIPVIEGYVSNVDQVDGQEVTFETKDQTVEVNYTKLIDQDTSTTPVKEENATVTPKQSQEEVQSKFVTTELPQTGEKDNDKVSAFGAVIASLAAGLGLAGIRRRKDEKDVK